MKQLDRVYSETEVFLKNDLVTATEKPVGISDLSSASTPKMSAFKKILKKLCRST